MGWVTESAEIYHAHKAISSHGLMTMRKSPEHYYAHYVTGEKPEPTEAMQLGTLLHMAVLEPKTFLERMRVAPACDRRTSEGKAIYSAFIASLKPHDMVLKEDDHKILQGVSKSILRNDAARRLLQNGVAEQSGYFALPLVGAPNTWGKMRADYRHPKQCVVDLKFVQDASYKNFQRQVVNFGYDVQASWYIDSTAILDECRPQDLDFVWIAIEKSPPYALAMYNASMSLLEAGRKKYEAALTAYVDCVQTGHWPGYTPDVVEMHLPRWANE